MFMRSALPYLRQLSDELIVSHSINIFGIGESAVDDMFSGEMNLMKNPSMAPYAKGVRLSASGHGQGEERGGGRGDAAPRNGARVASAWASMSTVWMWKIWSRAFSPR